MPTFGTVDEAVDYCHRNGIDFENAAEVDQWHTIEIERAKAVPDGQVQKDGTEKPLTADDIQNLVLTNREYFAGSRTTVYDFECDIRGEHDTLQYTLEYHDDREGFTIHTEKDDIWERMPEPELERLEGILSREAVYFKYHEKIAGAESLEALKELEYEIMEDESPYFSAVSERVWNDFTRKEEMLSGKTQETSGHDVQKPEEPGQAGYTTETVEAYPGEKNNLPYDIVVEKLHFEEPEKAEPEKAVRIDKSGVVNFHITEDSPGMDGAKVGAGFSPKEKFRKNIEAIRTLEKIEGENRIATPEEQKILAQYVGWGGLADAFDQSKSAWAGEYQELKSLLSDAEYASARESTLNAHYTSPVIIRSIYEALEHMGFEKGNVLEPAMGIGNFFGMLPENIVRRS